MRIPSLALCLMLTLPCAAKPGDAVIRSAAAALNSAGATGREFLNARAGDLETLVMGPAAPTLTPVEPSSCEALYRQRVALMRQQNDYRPAWSEDPRNQVAAAFGFVSSISFAYLPFTAVQTYLADSRRSGLEARIEQLRQASASQMCYQR